MSTIKSGKDKKKTKAAWKIGVTGFTIASLISWSMYQSVAWTIIHGLLGWFYLLYWAITQDPNADTFNNIIDFYKI